MRRVMRRGRKALTFGPNNRCDSSVVVLSIVSHTHTHTRLCFCFPVLNTMSFLRYHIPTSSLHSGYGDNGVRYTRTLSQ